MTWPAYSAELGYPLLAGAYGQLALETPAVADMPFAFPKPSTEEGTHLSYSLQWFAFGVLMFIGFGYAARQQARNAAIDAEELNAGDDGMVQHCQRTHGPASGRSAETPAGDGGGRGRRHPGRPGLLMRQ